MKFRGSPIALPGDVVEELQEQLFEDEMQHLDLDDLTNIEVATPAEQAPAEMSATDNDDSFERALASLNIDDLVAQSAKPAVAEPVEAYGSAAVWDDSSDSCPADSRRLPKKTGRQPNPVWDDSSNSSSAQSANTPPKKTGPQPNVPLWDDSSNSISVDANKETRTQLKQHPNPQNTAYWDETSSDSSRG